MYGGTWQAMVHRVAKSWTRLMQLRTHVYMQNIFLIYPSVDGHLGCFYVCGKSLQSCLALRDPMDCSPPGCPVHGILQARILEWVTIPSLQKIFLIQESSLHLLCFLYHQVGSLPLALLDYCYKYSFSLFCFYGQSCFPQPSILGFDNEILAKVTDCRNLN